MTRKKKAAAAVAVLLFLTFILVFAVRAWSDTPHGRLDWRAAILLKVADLLQIDPLSGDRTIDEVRAYSSRTRKIFQSRPVRLPGVCDLEIPGPAATIPVRLYQPEGEPPFPIIIYYHGGGWSIGDLDSHDNVCRYLAVLTPAVVLAVDYRLAPEHVFPAAVEDAFAALQWAALNGAAVGGDPARIAVAGDSAGGNLAAVVSRLAAEAGPSLAAQVLIYPAVDLSGFDTASHRYFRDGYFLTRGYIESLRDFYLPDRADWTDPRVSPLLHEVPPGLPPALVITAGFDPLRDEGEAYAAALAGAGVHVEQVRFPGMIHGFIGMDRILPAAREALELCASFLRATWAGGVPVGD